jgi:hypothetical protein
VQRTAGSGVARDDERARMWVRDGTLAPTLNSTFAPTFAPTTSASYSAYPDCLIDNLCLDHIDDKAWGIVVEVFIFAYAFIGLVS